MKRSKSVRLVAMGTGLFALAACDEAKVDTAIFESVSQCESQGFTKFECEQNFDFARNAHDKVAPKYTSRSDCEADFGAEQCEPAPYRTASGGSVFMPLMMGYMMGSMLGGANQSQPLYRARDDRANFRTADNRNVGATTGRTQVARSATRMPSFKTTTVSRGGFGATARRSAAG